MSRSRVLFLIILLLVPGVLLFSQRTTPVIRQADHILIESRNPKALFSIFADTLQLPVAWPLSESADYVSGGIGVNNLNLEIFHYPDRRIPATSYYGIAFEPYPLADALKRLQSLGIAYRPPDPVLSILPNGMRGTAWTTVQLPTLSKPGMSLFLYEYSAEFLKVDVRRKQMGNRLKLNHGGPLGIEKVSEIAISTTRLKEDAELWGKMLGKSGQALQWSIGGDTSVRLLDGKQDRIQGITFEVESLKRAKDFLQKSRLAGPAAGNGVFLATSKVQGLEIYLTGQP